MSDTLRAAYREVGVLTLGVLRFKLSDLLSAARDHRVAVAFWGIALVLLFGGYDAGRAFGEYVLPLLVLLGVWRLMGKVTGWLRGLDKSRRS